MAAIASISEPSKMGITCPLCDEKVLCTVRFDLSSPDEQPDRGMVLDVTPIFTPDVVEQFAPHLQRSHPVEWAKLNHPAAQRRTGTVCDPQGCQIRDGLAQSCRKHQVPGAIQVGPGLLQCNGNRPPLTKADDDA